MATKNCFIDKSRPCDLTCKAAFPVDDAVDPVDCFFIWLAGHLGDGVLDVRQLLEQRGFPLGPRDEDGPPGAGGVPPKGPGGVPPKGPGGVPPKGPGGSPPKGFGGDVSPN